MKMLSDEERELQGIIGNNMCVSCGQYFAPGTNVLAQNGKTYTFEFGEWKSDEEREQDRKDNSEFYEEIEKDAAREKDLKRRIDLVMEYDGGEATLMRALDRVIERLERGTE
jgi:hypothetical protein